MSLPEGPSPAGPLPGGKQARCVVPMRTGLAAAVVAASFLGSACTVRPLYSDVPVPGATAPMANQLASISVKPVTTRQAQEVRNQLIFLLAGGQGSPDSGAYTLDLTVTSQSTAAAVIQVSTTTQSPTSSLLTMRAFYTLTESATGKVVSRGRQEISSAYDVPQQQFAALRSQRDAENRAARELADLLRFALAQDLSRWQ